MASGQVILTDDLIARIYNPGIDGSLKLDSMARETVVESLKKNLHWRISDVCYPAPILVALLLTTHTSSMAMQCQTMIYGWNF